jgi:hypothetical protein
MKKLLYLLTSGLIVTLISCSPDADEAEQQSINAQNQLKTIKIELISEVPIGSSSPNSYDAMILYATGGGQIGSTVPNQVGQNTITSTFTAAPSSNIPYSFARYNYSIDYSSGNPVYNCICGEVTINVYSNDVLFHSLTKELGGGDFPAGNCLCPDGIGYSNSIIVPQ